MKVQLIHPPADIEYTRESKEIFSLRSAPPGLELIAKSISQFYPKAEIEIIDGNLISLEEILERIDGDFVGVSDWYSKHNNCIDILRVAKARGAVTVIGGPNVTHLGKRILKNHNFIDYVVVGDGEEAMAMLVIGQELSHIPNLVFRFGSEIITTTKRNSSLNLIFDLIHLSGESIQVYTKKIGQNTAPFPLSMIRGCAKATTAGRCSFCSIEHSLAFMAPEIAWKQIRLLNEKYGINYFFETGDSFFALDYPKRLLNARPNDLRHIKIRIYIGPREITKETVQLMVKLNIVEVFLGVETISDELLIGVKKNYTKKDINKALTLLSQNKINVQIPFMYGLPRETIATMDQNFAYAKEVVNNFPNIRVLSGPPIPLVGTELFENLRNHPRVKEEYNEGGKRDMDNDDSFDYTLLVKLQTKYFCEFNVTFEKVMEYSLKTQVLVKSGRAGGFSLPVSE